MLDLTSFHKHEREELKRELKYRNETLEDLVFLEIENGGEDMIVWSKKFVYIKDDDESWGYTWFVSAKRNYND